MPSLSNLFAPRRGEVRQDIRPIRDSRQRGSRLSKQRGAAPRGAAFGLLLAAASFAAAAQNGESPLEFRGATTLRGDFGGLSGLAVGADGRFVAVSDRALVVFGHLSYGDELKAEVERVTPLQGPGGATLEGADRDAEDLAFLPGGGVAVSFEQGHRVAIYDHLSLPPTRSTAIPTAWRALPENKGAEALAALPDGRLLALAEAEEDGRHAAWIGGDGGWRRAAYVAGEGLSPVSAAALPGGDVLVLERGFGFIGWEARIVRIPAAALDEDTLFGTELRRIRAPDPVDNFEALAVVPRGDGGAEIFVLSDDNFSIFQRSLLLHFRLRAGEERASPAAG